MPTLEVTLTVNAFDRTSAQPTRRSVANDVATNWSVG
jgi:hypothetical protein